MRNLQAKPTFYKGVLYRSKSEAKLAVCFDAWGVIHEYEPNAEHDNWKPDFLLRLKPRNSRLGLLIEYKPAMPNVDYIDDLASRFAALMDNELQICRELRVDCLVCELWCVDFWNNKVSGLSFWSEHDIQVIDRELENRDFSHGNRFRFDLA